MFDKCYFKIASFVCFSVLGVNFLIILRFKQYCRTNLMRTVPPIIGLNCSSVQSVQNYHYPSGAMFTNKHGPCNGCERCLWWWDCSSPCHWHCDGYGLQLNDFRRRISCICVAQTTLNNLALFGDLWTFTVKTKDVLRFLFIFLLQNVMNDWLLA